jgi:hypothetical protein
LPFPSVPMSSTIACNKTRSPPAGLKLPANHQ